MDNAHTLVIDGAHGEGGGQILRTALTLSAITGRPLRIENLRAGRPHPGMAAQHLTAVRACARLCDAQVEGAELGSQALAFAPGREVRAGDYRFDVAQARVGGSAGAVALVLQTLLPPLALAAGRSTLTLNGGTHIEASPPYDYIADVWLPMLRAMGVRAELRLERPGWFPAGCGEIVARIDGLGAHGHRVLRPCLADDPGPVDEVSGHARASNLPMHIPERMAERARAVLRNAGIEARIDLRFDAAACAGTGIFLTVRRRHAYAGFGALGRRGKPAEAVADEAAHALLRYLKSGAALDEHLADQILLPAALAGGDSRFTVPAVTRHLRTNAWVIERFGLARIAFEDAEPAIVHVRALPDAAGRMRTG